jgi:hypothetical protein
MKKYPILLVAWAVLSPSMARAGLKENLTAALQKYAIPKFATTCGTYAQADYDSAKGVPRCKCKDMFYDASDRQCVECDVSTFDEYATTCGAQSCAVGYALVERMGAGGDCLPGFVVKDVEWHCDTGIGPSGCSAGYQWVNVNIS